MIETLTPLAEQENLEIDSRFTVGQETDLAYDFFQNLVKGKYCGRVVVISWNHLQDLVKGKYCGRVVDVNWKHVLWQLHWDVGLTRVVEISGVMSRTSTQYWKENTCLNRQRYTMNKLKLKHLEYVVMQTPPPQRNMDFEIAYGYTSELGFDPLEYCTVHHFTITDAVPFA